MLGEQLQRMLDEREAMARGGRSLAGVSDLEAGGTIVRINPRSLELKQATSADEARLNASGIRLEITQEVGIDQIETREG